MNKEEIIKRALELFDREDLINDIEDLDTDIGVFMTVNQMIYYSNLQQENKQLKEQLGKLSKLDDTDFWLEYNRDVWKIQNENEKLKDNWNKLKEWTKKAVDKYYDSDIRIEMVYENVLNKMQELEKGDRNE